MNGSSRARAISYHADLMSLGDTFAVRAVFPHTWHLVNRDGWILSVTTAAYNGPLAVRIERRSLDDCRVMPGMTAHLDDGVLFVGPVEVGLRDAVMWTPCRRNAPVKGREGDRQALCSALRRASHRSVLLAIVLHAAERYGLTVPLSSAFHQLERGTGQEKEVRESSTHQELPVGAQFIGRGQASAVSPSFGCVPCQREPDKSGTYGTIANRKQNAFERQAGIAVEGLLRSLLEWDTASIPMYALDLLGLGPGLTPAGDDLLCGLLAGLRNAPPARRSTAARSFRICTSLAVTLEEAAVMRTTALGRTLLHFAGRGVAVEPLLDVLWSLSRDEPIVGLDALLAIGHSSGGDMLAGALLAALATARWEDNIGSARTRSA